jgi:DNA-binding transcriptional ArsR family regulator
MITGPIIAEIAALVGDPARATMVSALLDGRALTASELAVAARITPQTASTHLAKLTEAGLLSVVRRGRHRQFRLASSTVADMIDGDRRRRSGKETAIPPAIPSRTGAERGPDVLRPPCRPAQRRSHGFFRRPRLRRARRRSR